MSAVQSVESMVVTQLLAEHGRLSDWELFQAYQRQYSGRLTRDQLGRARRQLFDDGLVVMAGRKLNAGEDYAPAQTWRLSDKPSFRRGPMGESQPVSDHSQDPLVPEVSR